MDSDLFSSSVVILVVSVVLAVVLTILLGVLVWCAVLLSRFLYRCCTGRISVRVERVDSDAPR